MSKELQRAQAQFQAGEYKRAVDTLWEVTFVGPHADADAREAIALASLLRDATKGALRRDSEENIARAERYLASADPDARGRIADLERRQREDAAGLARKAREAGLTWLEIRRGEDVVAAEMDAVLGAEERPAPAGSMIDAVEAEGWRLAHVVAMFRPTKVQTSVLRGADFFMGGDAVDGDEVHIYLFRRDDGVSG
jgi:hypothetical protein